MRLATHRYGEAEQQRHEGDIRDQPRRDDPPGRSRLQRCPVDLLGRRRGADEAFHRGRLERLPRRRRGDQSSEEYKVGRARVALRYIDRGPLLLRLGEIRVSPVARRRLTRLPDRQLLRQCLNLRVAHAPRRVRVGHGGGHALQLGDVRVESTHRVRLHDGVRRQRVTYMRAYYRRLQACA